VSYAATRVRQQLRALAARPQGEPVPSPCNSVCRISEATGLCEGCLRTLDEIAGWGGMDEEHKRNVWRRLGERIALTPTLSRRERE
jgi:predicted Fe-S protein YdhL (DUF1289 family)